MKIQKLVAMAMLTALSVVLVALVHFPLFPAAAFLEYDPADIPVLIATLLFGPVSGLVITVIEALIQGVTVSAAGQVYGIVMHIIATGTYVLTTGLIAKFSKGKYKVPAALLCGALMMGVVMSFANILITPFYMNLPMEAVRDMILPVILPFNLLKAGINGAVTLAIYLPVSKALKRSLPQIVQ